MTSIIFRAFGVLFATVKILMITGAITAVLLAAQKRAFDSKRHGLISLTSINNQLFGNPHQAKKTAR
jgi:hypothetical protein